MFWSRQTVGLVSEKFRRTRIQQRTGTQMEDRSLPFANHKGKEARRIFSIQDVLSFRAAILLGVFRKTLNPLFRGGAGAKDVKVSRTQNVV